jgi:hypothetical protein
MEEELRQEERGVFDLTVSSGSIKRSGAVVITIIT